MQWACYLTTGTSAVQHFPALNLVQPCSACCLLLSHAAELHSQSELLLSRLSGSKAPSTDPFGQAIEFWVCAQRCVYVGGLVWSRMGVCWRVQ